MENLQDAFTHLWKRFFVWSWTFSMAGEQWIIAWNSGLVWHRNIMACIFWKHDRCNFAHSGSRQLTGRGVDLRQQRMDLDSRQHRRNLDSSPRRQEDRSSQGKPCKFGANCDRILRCGFLHSAKDFLSVQGQRRNWNDYKLVLWRVFL